MSTLSRSNLRAWTEDRRVQIGGAVGLSLAALLGAGLIATVMHSRAEAVSPDLGSQARLTIITQQPPKPIAVDNGKLATLDQAQTSAAQTSAPQADPGLQAVLDEERRQDQRTAAEQAAFEAKMRAEMAPTPTDDEAPPLPQQQPVPASPGGWTSNSEDTPA